MNLTPDSRDRLLERVLKAHKYRETGLNPQTVLDLIDQEAPRQTSEKALYKAVRTKLHNIVAPYLGDPDYASLTEKLDALANPTLDSPELRAICLEALKAHASTAERIPEQEALYQRLFAATGQPTTILDLACALHPLAFPWMGLPLTTAYHAYDIVQPRVDFINHFFEVLGMAPLAENRDILVNPRRRSKLTWAFSSRKLTALKSVSRAATVNSGQASMSKRWRSHCPPKTWPVHTACWTFIANWWKLISRRARSEKN